MAETEGKRPMTDIPTQVFEKFLEELHAAEISEGVCGRLKRAFESNSLTEAALRAAILSED